MFRFYGLSMLVMVKPKNRPGPAIQTLSWWLKRQLKLQHLLW